MSWAIIFQFPSMAHRHLRSRPGCGPRSCPANRPQHPVPRPLKRLGGEALWLCHTLRLTMTIEIVWLVVYLPLWKILVSRDYYSQLNGKIKNVPNHKPAVDLPIKNGDVQTNYVGLPEDTVFGTWLSGSLLHFLGVSSPSVGPDVLGEQSHHGKPLIPSEKDWLVAGYQIFLHLPSFVAN